MAPQTSSSITLRVITQRLAVTPVSQLPNIVVHLASSITTCKTVLATSDLRDEKTDGSDVALLVHKLKIQLSALLQNKSPEARWGAIVLIKATIETGGWEVQRGCGAWVRGLLGILSKTDPPATKKLCIIALTRIFLLLEGYQSLVREITTPSLPSFIISCLNLVKPQIASRGTKKTNGYNATLNTILQSFCKLLPQHPTIFRPFLSQIRSLILPLIAATPSNLMIDEDSKHTPITSGTSVAQSSRQLFVLLSCCAPKNTSAEDWAESLQVVVKSLHRTADRAFRAVFEDWEPSSSRAALNGKIPHDFADIVCGLDEYDSGLPAWRGIHAGIERINGLLHILQVFLETPTRLPVRIPVGALIDATERILSIFPPDGESETNYDGPIVNPEAGKEEREGLWTGLSMIHVSALELLSLVILRLGRSSAIASHVILERSLWVFDAERSNGLVRTTVYRLVSDIIRLLGWSLPKTIAPLLSNCIRSCCEDLVPLGEQRTLAENSAASVQRQTLASVSINADSYLKFPIRSAKLSENLQEIETSAASLLSVTVSHVPKDFFTYSLRAQIDRTAILIRSKPTMLASVLNPPIRRKGAREPSSIMPLLAREFPYSLEVEALLRPRMPVLKTRKDDIEELVSHMNADEGLEEQTIEHREQGHEVLNTQFTDDSLLRGEIRFHEEPTTIYTEIRATVENQLHVPSQQQMPETATPTTSQKRDRESSPSPNDPPQPADPEILYGDPSSELKWPPKRARLEVDYSSTQEMSTSSATELGLTQRHQSPVSEKTSITMSKVPPRTHPDASFAAGRGSSDGSDSEIPVIDLESDTDLEDDQNE